MGDDNPPWHRQSQTAKEQSSQENQVDYGRDGATIPVGGSIELLPYTNTTGGQVLLEMITVGQSEGYTETLSIVTQLFDTVTGPLVQLDTNRTDFPIAFDPALPLPDDNEIRIVVENNSSGEIDMFTTVVIRLLN